MRLKNYKFNKTLRELLDRSRVAEVDLQYRIRCPYNMAHPTPLTYETKVYPFLIAGNEIIAEITCPECGRTHYRLIRFMSSPIESLKAKLSYISSDVLRRVDKRELEAYTCTPISTILENYRNLWTRYRAKYQENYTLHYSYKNKFPKDKVYTSLLQIDFNKLSSTAQQVLQMNSSYYPIEAFRVALDMIEEQ